MKKNKKGVKPGSNKGITPRPSPPPRKGQITPRPSPKKG